MRCPWRCWVTPLLPRHNNLALLALAVGLAGCAGQAQRAPMAAFVPPPASQRSTQAPNPRAPKIGKPYQVFGTWYYPADDRDYDQHGIASWYGPGFHALNTANGETYDQQGISAAHKTLPLPSYVEVENLDNGRRLTVRINDRGPFVEGRIIDLSQRSAQLLGVDRPGTARVRVRRVLPDAATIASLEPPVNPAAKPAAVPIVIAAARAPAPPITAATDAAPVAAPQAVALVDIAASSRQNSIVPTPATHRANNGSSSFVQVAAVSDPGRIAWLSGYLGGFGPVVTERIPSGLTRIRLGPYESIDSANAALARVQAAGYTDARLIQGTPLR